MTGVCQAAARAVVQRAPLRARRAIVAARKCLLFEPGSASSRKFLEVAAPRLQANEARAGPAAPRCLTQQARHAARLDPMPSAEQGWAVRGGMLLVCSNRVWTPR